jgi:hypothetical protein
MLFKLLKPAAVALAFCFSMSSSAGLITDTVVQKEKLSFLDAHTYQHNLNDEGFTLGSALSGTLSIDIWDDGDSKTFFGLFTIPDEGGVIVVEGFDGDTGGLTGGNSDFTNSVGVEALAALNADGFLEVTVKSLLGDFWVGNSVLSVVTADVPEPSSLALLGLGLMGLGYARRKQRAA